ncbi:uncharacterized protein AMSG_11595 [Thecamonas trahens ATCC 50062]|uniref:JmjC domain-containing protein n=1 Tax=Thecamonas trahens ATCC 50062 TaxID=461836 RepID=A0A0L0D1L3_THETB|nr:hypothetical protein AMSG_11595 [Thecamonas trahens ATCC 50062]KNC46091.1 hypothetical protein AMSG_11595 [Thecamonas trahens ATCC 50062]|eukprot:XP_013763193.1 hypothetical protein AMSG_11595 [Thecamonas trahens ATCC 50062]
MATAEAGAARRSLAPFVAPFFVARSPLAPSPPAPLGEWAETAVAEQVPSVLRAPPEVAAWGATAKWTPEYLDEALGQSPLPAKLQSYGSASAAFFPRGCCPLGPMTAKAVMDGTSGYGYASVPGEWFLAKDARLAADIGSLAPFVAPLGAHVDDIVHQLWLSSRGVVTPLHDDYPANFFVQLYGSKELVLFPPEAYRDLGLFPRSSFYHRQLAVDLRLDPGRGSPCWPGPLPCTLPHSLFATNKTAWKERMAALQGAGLRVVLNEGDVLYLPPLWFHTVRTHDASISTNFWVHHPALLELDRLWEVKAPSSPSALRAVVAGLAHRFGPDFVLSVRDRWLAGEAMTALHDSIHPEDPDWKGYLEEDRSTPLAARVMADPLTCPAGDSEYAAAGGDGAPAALVAVLDIVAAAENAGGSAGQIEIVVGHWLEAAVEHVVQGAWACVLEP